MQVTTVAPYMLGHRLHCIAAAGKRTYVLAPTTHCDVCCGVLSIDLAPTVDHLTHLLLFAPQRPLRL